ncbi:MAG: SDR family NAD(P)-dependent oxidoreductase, partial [Bdellovibrionales bacterium]
DLVILATGILHQGALVRPEKSLKDIDPICFADVFLANTIGPSLVMKYFLPHMNKERKSVFAVLSARVGSISDNQLGGWYSYRSSKAALNMMVKTASIEMARSNQNLCVVGLHPGTVDTDLSRPFQKNVSEEQLFSPEQSSRHLLDVIDGLSSEQTGQLFAWDGKEIQP